jgi:hypothetical protein
VFNVTSVMWVDCARKRGLLWHGTCYEDFVESGNRTFSATVEIPDSERLIFTPTKIVKQLEWRTEGPLLYSSLEET